MNKIIVKVGDKFHHRIHGWYEVIEVIDNLYVKVRFDNTKNEVKCNKYHCKNGDVCDKKSNRFHQVGEKYSNKYGDYEIIQILPHKKAIVRFISTGTEVECHINNIIHGRVKDFNKQMIKSVGFIGVNRRIGTNNRKELSYTCWSNMIRRCFDVECQKKHPTYIGCHVCDEWLDFSKFKRWFDKHYIKGWCLDKDILVKGNKEYSPDKCCFVPNDINTLFTKRQNCRGNLPIGVQFSESKKRYKAFFSRGRKKKFLGCFGTKEDAFLAYKKAKEKWIKEVANKWKDKLEPKVYEAMINYQVEITD